MAPLGLPLLVLAGCVRSSAALMLPQVADPDAGRQEQNITMITTAAVPWLTGTAVNPLMRAVYLTTRGFSVTLALPWVEEESAQRQLFKNVTFATPVEQEVVIRQWIRGQSVEYPEEALSFLWYGALWVHTAGSLVARDPLAAALPDHSARGILIAEEPEHLTTFEHGCWKSQFAYVVGIVHTNYEEYMEDSGIPEKLRRHQTLFWETLMDQNVDLVLDLSAFRTHRSQLAKVMPIQVANVNGVATTFFEIGEETAAAVPRRGVDEVPAYFVANALWSKGYAELLDLAENVTALRIDTFGSGADEAAIASAAAERTAGRAVHHPRIDHDDERLRGYRVLVNPATSDVLCTVTMEALAMGKRAVLPRHPSNSFFHGRFPGRVFAYDLEDPGSFAAAYASALEQGAPAPLPDDMEHFLTWDAATDRLLDIIEPGSAWGRNLENGTDASYCKQERGMAPADLRVWQETLWKVAQIA